MKQKMKKAMLVTIVAICAANLSYAQFNTGGTGVNNRWGQTNDPPFTINDIRRIGIGHFNNFGSAPTSAFHINANYMTPVSPAFPNFFLPGEVFHTTGPSANVHAWRMFTGTGNGEQSFSLTTLPNFGGISLTTFQNQPMQFHTNNSLRMHINANFSPTNQGFIGMGTNFSTPQSRLHLNEQDPDPPVNGGTSCYAQWTNSATGNNDALQGLRIGINGAGVAEIRQQENLGIVFFTNNFSTARFIPNTASTLPGNPGMMGIGNFLSALDPIDAKLDIDGDLRIREVTQDNSLTRILVIDPLDQNRVHWIDATATSLGNVCGSTQNPLTDDFEIPMDGFSYNYTTPITTNSSVNIGSATCLNLPARLSVTNDIHLAAGLFTTNGNIGTNAFGVVAQTTNTGGNATGITSVAQGDGNLAIAVNGNSTGSGTISNIGLNSNAGNAINQSFAVNADVIGSSSPFNYGYQTEILSGSNASATSYGVHSTIFNNGATNYGGYFVSQGATTNYAIYAEALPESGNNPPTGPNYAGYFVGDVVRTGNDNFTSDINLKQNINQITDGLDIVNQLNPVTFEFNQAVNPYMGLAGGLNYGFIAQEIEGVLPDLVRDEIHPPKYDSLGVLVHEATNYKSLNYQGIIPVLTKGIQEQQALIASQDSIINDLNDRLTLLENCLSNILPTLCNVNSLGVQDTPEEMQQNLAKVINLQLSDKNNIVLNQNVPNPFAEKTVISYSIPATVGRAQIHFYDGKGNLINAVEITERGSGEINVYANDLSTGVYTYSLVAEGQIVATKRMMKH